jgi:hypothetical protein
MRETPGNLMREFTDNGHGVVSLLLFPLCHIAVLYLIFLAMPLSLSLSLSFYIRTFGLFDYMAITNN